MRTRTVLGAVTSVLLLGLWNAPVALAADQQDDDRSPPSSSAAPKPDSGDGDGGGSGDSGSGGGSGDSVQKQLTGPSPSADPEPGNQVVPQLVEPRAVLALAPAQVKPGGQFAATAACTVGSGTLSAARDVSFSGTVGTVSDDAAEGDVEITLKCVDGGRSAEASKTLRVLAASEPDGPTILPVPGPGAPEANRARLSVPDQVYPGDRFRADTFCAQGGGSLGAPFVRFQGQDGFVDEAAREGRVEVLLRCGDNDEARAFFYVKKKYDGFDGKARLHLDPNSGERGEEVDIRAYCPGSGRGRFESDGLVDTRLNFDGGRLTGQTHVENGANFGKTHGRLICDNGDRDWDRFYVERDEHDRFLDIDPNHGNRGDEIDIRVHCDRDLKKLESDVLDDIELDRDGEDWWKYSGTTHVDSDADHGEHTIRIKCGDDWLEDDFFVQRDGDEGDSGEQSGLYPKGGVETGGGPVATGDGVPAGTVALGLSGVLGAVLAGAGGALETRAARR